MLAAVACLLLCQVACASEKQGLFTLPELKPCPLDPAGIHQVPFLGHLLDADEWEVREAAQTALLPHARTAGWLLQPSPSDRFEYQRRLEEILRSSTHWTPADLPKARRRLAQIQTGHPGEIEKGLSSLLSYGYKGRQYLADIVGGMDARLDQRLVGHGTLMTTSENTFFVVELVNMGLSPFFKHTPPNLQIYQIEKFSFGVPRCKDKRPSHIVWNSYNPGWHETVGNPGRIAWAAPGAVLAQTAHTLNTAAAPGVYRIRSRAEVRSSELVFPWSNDYGDGGAGFGNPGNSFETIISINNELIQADELDVYVPILTQRQPDQCESSAYPLEIRGDVADDAAVVTVTFRNTSKTETLGLEPGFPYYTCLSRLDSDGKITTIQALRAQPKIDSKKDYAALPADCQERWLAPGETAVYEVTLKEPVQPGETLVLYYEADALQNEFVEIGTLREWARSRQATLVQYERLALKLSVPAAEATARAK